MGKSTNTNTAERLASKKAELLAELKKIEAKEQAEKARERERDRKKADNRKYLIGGMMIAKMAESEEVKDGIMAELETYLVRDCDRRAFGFQAQQASGASTLTVAPPLAAK